MHAASAAESPAESREPMAALSQADLESRLEQVDKELRELASLSLLSGVGSVGYRSRSHDTPNQLESIEIALEAEQPIDQIVLVPTICRDARAGFRADGFPVEFRVIVGSRQDPQGKVVAEFRAENKRLPRIAPLVIDCPPTMVASWVRLEATELSPRAWDGMFTLQMAEILVFREQENIALHRPVVTTSPEVDGGLGWDPSYLVDGFVPYHMDAAKGQRSLAFLRTTERGEPPVISFDLGKTQPLDRIHYHVTDLSDTVPQSISDGFGVPRRFYLEGAQEPGFSDAVRLMEYERGSAYEVGPIIIRRFPRTMCRYVRLVAEEPPIRGPHAPAGIDFGAAEIELFAEGRNVAKGVLVQSPMRQNPWRSLAALTDGNNLYGEILPIREWMNQLARRHELEGERPWITRELDRRYVRLKMILVRLGWLSALVAAALVAMILWERMRRMKQIALIRERLAADLHDELGANLHTIGLLSDLAANAGDSPADLATLHRRIRAETERSGIAVRHCSDMLSANGFYTDLLGDMQRASNRIMANLRHTIAMEGEEQLQELPPRTRADLFLFYKECLVNIGRHSGATEYTTELKADASGVRLTICDNGCGLEHSEERGVPASLKRRAKLLGAQVSVQNAPEGGTCIRLDLKARKWKLWKLWKLWKR